MDTNKNVERLNEAGKSIPNSSDELADILRFLMTYCVCPEDKLYNRRAVSSLLKKLQENNKKDLDSLIEAITTQGAQPSKCFTVPRTLDGRFQVAARKGFPHIVYARIWRWGDLKKDPITHIPSCNFGYDLNRDKICVNPYHYKKFTSLEEFISVTKSKALNSIKNGGGRNKNKKEAHSKNTLDNDGGMEQDMPQQQKQQQQQQEQQSQKIHQLNREKLIPIVVEHQSDATEYIESQQPLVLTNYNEKSVVQPQDSKSYSVCDTINVNNKVESTIPPSSINDQCGYLNNMYNSHQPAVESNLNKHNDGKLLQSHGHNENNTPLQLQSGTQENKNNFIQDNRDVKTPEISLTMCEQVLLNQSDFHINLPPPSSTVLVNNSPLLPNCNQRSQDLVPGDVGSISANKMPLPNKTPLLSNPTFVNSNRQIKLPPPSSTPLPNNPTILMNNAPLLSGCNQELQGLVTTNSMFVNSNQQISLPPPSNTPLRGNPLIVNSPILVLNDSQQLEERGDVESALVNEMPSLSKITLSSNSMYVNSNRKISLPPPSGSPLTNNPSMLSHYLLEGENFQAIEKQPNEQLKNYTNELQDKDKSLSITLERILAEVTGQQPESNIPTVNTLNETLERILSQDQNNNQNKSELKALITQLTSTEKQPNEQLQNCSHELQNKDKSLNSTLEQILSGITCQQPVINNPMENTLNETLQRILSQDRNNNQSLSDLNTFIAQLTSTEIKTKSLNCTLDRILVENNSQQPNENTLNENLDRMLSQVSSINQNLSEPKAPVIQSKSTENEQNEQLRNCCNELKNKYESLNFTLERILTENNSEQAATNNPMENTLKETLDQILSQVQNDNQNLQAADQKLENKLSDNYTKPITSQSNIEQLLNSSKKIASDNEPDLISNYKEMMEHSNNQQSQSISNISDLIQNIEEALSPISAIPPPSPIHAITPLSPARSIARLSPAGTCTTLPSASNTRSLSPDQFECITSTNFLPMGDKDKTTAEEGSKHSANKIQLQSDKTVLNKSLQEKMSQNNNTRQTSSQFFTDSMLSFINNNVVEQVQMTAISKCLQYVQNQPNMNTPPAHIQTPTKNNNNHPDSHNEANNLQTLQNNGKQNNEQQVQNPIKPPGKELQRTNANDFFNRPNMMRRNAGNLIPLGDDDEPLEHWCSIDYYELDIQVGDTFKVANEYTTVTVDGYLDPDGGNRFSLGRLTNLSRTEQSERTRIHIAQGIDLEYRDDGDIWLRCKSKTSVFIQAHFLDVQSGRQSRNIVHKIFSEDYKKVFDIKRCCKHLKAQIATAHAALKAQRVVTDPGRSVTNFSGLQGLEALGMNVDDLRRLCILKISFVKGWGNDYPRRTIKETPCWIEVHIHKALQVLDKLLLLDKPIVRGWN